MTHKVAIVARAGTSALAPWHDDAYEIWGMPWVQYPRVDRLFEMHSQDCVDGSQKLQEMESRWLPYHRENLSKTPVYCDESRAHLFENAVRYPIEDVEGILPVPFLENSVAYMIALAILEGVKEISLYGVHMIGSREYMIERASVLYLIGYAQGRGIDVSIVPGSPLFMSAFEAGRYGLGGKMRNIYNGT